MRKIVVDMQNFLFADSVATAFKKSDYEIDVVRAESPLPSDHIITQGEFLSLSYKSFALSTYASFQSGEFERKDHLVQSHSPS